MPTPNNRDFVGWCGVSAILRSVARRIMGPAQVLLLLTLFALAES
jgi:hypothetical protein